MTATIVPDYAQLAERLAKQRKGLQLALTNGCFDLLHVGHIRLIRDSAAQGDLLVVALNTDASIRRNKGPERPLVPLTERMEVVAAIEGVDWVTSFSEPTADGLIAALRPEVHCKGTDWTVDSVPERAAVEAYGGRIAICGDPKSHSSSELVQRLNRVK